MRSASTLLLLGGFATMAAQAKPGDLNNNNVVDKGDAGIALQIAGGRAIGAGQIAVGDVAGPAGNVPDGKITILDAVRIARAAAGLDDLGGGGAPGALAVALQQAVGISGPATRNFQLPPGHLLTGTVKDTAGNSITDNSNPLSSTSGTIGFENAANLYASDTADVEPDATFSIVVPAGTNTATVETNVFSLDLNTFTYTSYTVAQTPTPASVVVNGTKTQAFVRPNLPSPGKLQGSISGGGVTVSSVHFDLNNGGDGLATVEGTSYNLTAPPGAGTVSFYGALASNNNVSVSATFANAPQTVVSGQTKTYNITIPTLATLKGTVTPPAGISISSASVGNTGASGPSGYQSNNNVNGATAYTLAIPPGAYSLTFVSSAIRSGSSSLTWLYNTPVTVAAGETTKNVTLPALPATFAVQGTVTGPDNKAVASASVVAIPSSGGSGGGWQPIAQATTAANGAYSITLPAGNYTFVVDPPAPDHNGN